MIYLDLPFWHIQPLKCKPPNNQKTWRPNFSNTIGKVENRHILTRWTGMKRSHRFLKFRIWRCNIMNLILLWIITIQLVINLIKIKVIFQIWKWFSVFVTVLTPFRPKPSETVLYDRPWTISDYRGRSERWRFLNWG